MAKHHGKDAFFKVNSVDLTTYLNNIEFPQSVETAETTTMGAEAKTFIPGLSEATIGISGLWDETVTTGPDAVLAALVGNDTAVTFEYGPQGGDTGDIKYSGSCFLTSYQTTAPLGDVVAFSADFQVTGAVTRGTFS